LGNGTESKPNAESKRRKVSIDPIEAISGWFEGFGGGVTLVTA
jgi:hypothetical protein